MSTRFTSPVNLTVVGFCGLIAGGFVLLLLPVSAAGPGLPAIDALFTATSACCVTGLTVVDTGRRLSLFGQWIVLGLIQVGGLGFMSLSTVVILSLGGKFSFRKRQIIEDTFTSGPDHRLPSLIRSIVLFTLLFEGLGTGLLYLAWARKFPPATALYQALFHSVSAFCNAGFGLFSDSLMGFAADPLVCITMGGLIIAGGIGFVVLMEIRLYLGGWILQRKPVAVSTHTRLVLAVTAVLLSAGTLWFLALEWDGALAGFSTPLKVMTAGFQSATARTAGFSTLDFGGAANATLLFTILLMFVGAAPGSTGGGIKVTTLGVLSALAMARLRGREVTPLFRRSISRNTEIKAIAVYSLSLVLIVSASLGILVVEGSTPAAATDRGQFIPLLFETVSAFGTVGLSLGITSQLTPGAKLILTLVMFIGRLGPLTIAYAVSRQLTPPEYRYAEDKVMIG
ncbi:MAG: potassium transporter TrkG [Desulfobacterales bacterium]